MNTQLILYPQSFKGSYSSVAVPPQYLVDGITFNSVNISFPYTATNSPANLGLKQALVYQDVAGILQNTWYRVRSNWTGSPKLPETVGGVLVLDSIINGGDGSFCGVYQRLSNLVVGATYTITVDWDGLVAPGYLRINHYDGTTLIPSSAGAGFANASLPQITYEFQALTSQDIIAFSLLSTITSELYITNISITSTEVSPSEVYADLTDGQVICDLYEEEDIPLTLSIDDFKNVAEQVQSYSKDFDLPATKRNNQIFNNMFEITRSDDGLIFNPYAKTKCILKQDGFLLFEGYLRLLNIKDKKGEISYNVNLYSEVIALAETLKDLTLGDLDLEELNHAYTKVNIKASWENIGAGNGLLLTNALSTSSFAYDAITGVNNTQVLKYPFIDWTHQYIVGGTGSSSATANYPELTLLEQAFRPCIQIKYLISKIFAAAGFNWTSNFFNSTISGGDTFDFDKLYMDFNWGGDQMPGTTTTYNASWQQGFFVPPNIGTGSWKNFELVEETASGGLAGSTLPPNYDLAANEIQATANNEVYVISYSFFVEYTGGSFGSAYCRWIHTDSVGTQIAVYDHTYFPYISLQTQWQGSFSVSLDSGDILSAQFNGAVTIRQGEFAAVTSTAQFVQTTGIATASALLTLRGEIGQWDFIKGIFTMFNLVSMVDESNPNNILIEPYSEVFINNPNSVQHDWTDKIDGSQMELKPLMDLNKTTIFKFVEDDDDYIFNIFKLASSGHLYGSKKLDASFTTDGRPTILQGIKEIVAEPFAATVSLPLMYQFPSFIVPMVYALNDDGSSEGFDNSPRIFYNNGIKDTGVTYYIPEQNGESSENQPEILQFSHLSTVPTLTVAPYTKDFLFESAQLQAALGSPPTDNLYSTYWQPYLHELYHADTRTMTLKVNLNASDVAAFKFYDTVFIRNRSFRVNKIEYKPNTLAKVEFILIA